jgi:hypothetical protein
MGDRTATVDPAHRREDPPRGPSHAPDEAGWVRA